MKPTSLLFVFLLLRAMQHLAERGLARLNRNYYLDAERQREACALLGIEPSELQRTVAYSDDKFRFATVASWVQTGFTIFFLASLGLGVFEAWAVQLAERFAGGQLTTGLIFFGILAAGSMLLSLPFEYYRIFVVETRHGFNRQTPRGFWLDRVKGLALGILLGTPLLALVLWIMATYGDWWWLYAWIAMTVFSVLTAWLFPTFLAPLFNKFSPLKPGELSDAVTALAQRVGFRMAGVYVMDASQRSSHGNAYFTGVFGKKRIVLFDTLVTAMSVPEVVAVLAHELGHFKLHHVRWGLLRGTLMTGLSFYLLSLCLPLTPFYQSFGLVGVSNYGALVVFGLWFGTLDFLLQPISTALSRRNEFAADRFAMQNLAGGQVLGSALLKLRETSHAMPITHPLYSRLYYSHPPLLERLAALGFRPE